MAPKPDERHAEHIGEVCQVYLQAEDTRTELVLSVDEMTGIQVPDDEDGEDPSDEATADPRSGHSRPPPGRAG